MIPRCSSGRFGGSFRTRNDGRLPREVCTILGIFRLFREVCTILENGDFCKDDEDGGRAALNFQKSGPVGTDAPLKWQPAALDFQKSGPVVTDAPLKWQPAVWKDEDGGRAAAAAWRAGLLPLSVAGALPRDARRWLPGRPPSQSGHSLGCISSLY